MSIQTIRTFTEDALANQFQMIIPPFPGVGNLEQTNLRVLTVDIPEMTHETYEITKNGTKFTRPSGISGNPTEFSFTYRIDKNYEAYLGFIRWHRLIRDPQTGIMAPESSYRVPITVQPIDTAGNALSGGWLMQGCFISSHDGISFDEESGDPLTASVTMQMLGYDPIIA